ncbi:L-type lectin-domain containing receptor kinase IX.1-like protein [Trifolium pratense]|uniref:non-specific serine/threonine protein kinase n=1 Tax=Trifolium pratense TaxID=57577 RepID=A0A2K3PIT4_TRIPR|nr:L-type lectin-domain containing receptor kinase IX.1-like protein [Trifolium pratense]PNY14309.1 L-type lectin-domain containing receptor kinase IX.1-like protein [Trifolium pratense]PNY15199.1 L-type lectin-domain containing receptor kinase IX.1-like protein [Trifolium pratense]
MITTSVKPLSFDYQGFKYDDVKPEGDASLLYSYIQLTSTSRYQTNTYSVGRVTCFEPLQLWDKTSRKLTDFTTKFSFVIYSNKTNFGDGLAFFFADPELPLPEHMQEGGGLGLVDKYQIMNSTKYSFLAVEFDTHQNSWDPSGMHVGINFNSMMSIKTKPWSIDISNKTAYYDCKIQYNSSAHNLKVSYTGSIINAATGVVFEMNTLMSWSFNSSLQIHDVKVSSPISTNPSPSPIHNSPKIDSNKYTTIWVGLGVGVVSATNNFEETQKIGQGGFGGVYKGYLKDIDTNVAIKRISRESKQGIKEYATEVKIISQLRHRNLVQLIGWCHMKKDFLLIYEFMQNGSLDSHLYRGKSLLTWPMRYNIAMDLASALLYLHEEWEQCVIHRDIKSSNIMLDYNFNAKLGDFGMARLVDHEKESQSTTIIAGTMGYIAPEYYTTGKATKESDIYSFGIVSLELASGRKPIDLNAKEDQVTIFDWVRELYRLGRFLEVVDTKLEGIFDEEQMERLVVIGLWCANPNYSFRPSARQVIQVLKFEAPLPILQHMMLESIYSPKTMNTIFGPVSSSFVEDDFDVHKVTR